MSFYQPAHSPTLSKHNKQVFEFDSPHTIRAKQQQRMIKMASLQPFVQADGVPAKGFSSAPTPPSLPQLAYKPSHELNLRTRDWTSQPWKNVSGNQGDTYYPPAYFIKWNLTSSSRTPVYLNSPYKNWGNRSISSTTSSPRTPSLLGVYDPELLAGQRTHLQHSEHHLPSSSSSYSSAITPDTYDQSTYSSLSQTHHPSTLPPFAQSSEVPHTYSGLSSPSKGIHSSGLPTTHYQPSSTIPLSHNYHLPSSGLAHSTTPSSSLSQDNWSSDPNWTSSSSSNIPSAPAWTGFKHGTWRSNRTRSMKPLHTRNWGKRSENGWSGFNSENILSESFLLNRPRSAPMPPSLPSLFNFQRKWKTGPYRQRNIRTHSWGLRGEEGWSNFNRGLYHNESALPFNVNRQRFFNESQQSFAPVQQQRSIAPIQQQQSFAPVQQQQSSFTRIAAPVVAAPLISGAPLPVPIIAGRKGRKAAKKAATQQAIQQKLSTELNPPLGAPASGSLGSGRAGRRNNIRGRRARGPATQPQLGQPSVTPLSANSAAFTPSFASTSGTHAPSFQRAPSQQNLVNSAGVPLSANGMILQQPALLEKQFAQPAVLNARPTGSATF